MKYATIYRFLFFVVFIALLGGTGCITNERLASKRVAKLIERFPNIIDTTAKVRVDTTKITITVNRAIYDSAKVNTAYNSIDSLINELKLKGDCDTVIIERVKGKIKQHCTIESLLKPYSFDTTGVHLEIYAKGNKLYTRVTLINLVINKDKEKTLVIPCQQLTYWTGLKWEWPWLLAILFLLVVLFLSRR